MEVRGQLPGHEHRYPLNRRVGGLIAGLDILEKGKISYFCWDSNLLQSIVQSLY